ncbi:MULTISPECIES: DNA-binding protein [Pseudomonas]|jgi:probable addiction module antidote protein|uniref:helix-turn-helix domain-containing transcriptional regulator n=1 Tax=Pseudomonas TaxID=286 RepID=UPI0005BC4506|nr:MULTISPECIES: DNA-binding protein [Pseudomonas]MDU9415544.1 DNA-binding protein [Pseudomonas sp. zfem005]MDW3712914.1 DNA-binding protein [Pseudomonas sp. 2023EL-01195]
MKSVSNHEDSVLEMLRNDEDFALEYLVAALEEIDEEGGEAVFLNAVRRIIEARGGFQKVSQDTGLNRGNLYRQFAAGGNPGLLTLTKVLSSVGLGLSKVVTHSQEDHQAA